MGTWRKFLTIVYRRMSFTSRSRDGLFVRNRCPISCLCLRRFTQWSPFVFGFNFHLLRNTCTYCSLGNSFWLKYRHGLTDRKYNPYPLSSLSFQCIIIWNFTWFYLLWKTWPSFSFFFFFYIRFSILSRCLEILLYFYITMYILSLSFYIFFLLWLLFFLQVTFNILFMFSKIFLPKETLRVFYYIFS